MDNLKQNVNKIVGLKFKIQRQKANLTQEDVSVSIGLNRPAIANIESGGQGCTIFTILKAASLFNCEISELLPNKNDIKFNIKSPDFIKAGKIKSKMQLLQQKLEGLKLES